GALALHAVDRIDQVLRDRVDVALAGRIGRVARRGDRAGAAGEGVPAATHRRLVVAEVAILVAAAQRDADPAIGEGVAEDARQFSGPVVAAHRPGQVVDRTVVHRLQPHARERAAVERARGLDVDRRTDAAGRRLRAA